MWTQKHSTLAHNVKKEDIWRIWTDVNNWPKWHNDLESCTMNGLFEVGNYFILKPKGLPLSKLY